MLRMQSRGVLSEVSAMANRKFRGDGDLMVDALVRASQEAKQRGAESEPAQRTLTPYFIGGVDAPGEEHINTALAVNPQPARKGGATEGKAKGKGAAKAPAVEPVAGAPGDFAISTPQKRARSRGQQAADENQLSCSPPNGNIKRNQRPPSEKAPALTAAVEAAQAAAAEAFAAGKRAGRAARQAQTQSPPKPSPAPAQPPPAKPKAPKAPQAPSQGWAGPSFSNAPAPDTLPVPSFLQGGASLLSRSCSAPPVPVAAIDPSEQLRAMLSIRSEPTPAVATRETFALRQLLGVAC